MVFVMMVVQMVVPKAEYSADRSDNSKAAMLDDLWVGEMEPSSVVWMDESMDEY